MDIVIRPAVTTDFDFILRVNRENVEVLSPMNREKLQYFTQTAAAVWVATADGVPAAFLIALTEDASSYDSENNRWFRQHYPHFLYIDRIVIDAPFRHIGLGRALYKNVFAYAQNNGIPVVTAEIDTVPYNGTSLLFHEAMGFVEVGTQSVRGGSVQVSLQVADVNKNS